MKITLQNDKYGEIVYEESSFSGKVSLSFDGISLKKNGKKAFETEDGTLVTVKGSTITGVKLFINDEVILITAGLKWYEYTIAIIGCIITLVWGNVEPLVMIFPVIGGAVGGFVFVAVAMVCIAFALKMKNPIARLLLVITGSVGGFVACGIVGYIFVFLIAAL